MFSPGLLYKSNLLMNYLIKRYDNALKVLWSMDSHPWIPNSNRGIREKMLKKIGVKNIDELFSDIPRNVRISKEEWDNLEIGLKNPVSEITARRIIEEKLSMNKVFVPLLFLGGGAYPHYVPSVIKYLISRGEFLTSYTPYQPEISQGILQALFEYQSLMAELLDMDVVNSSMYDWASALAEALLMSLRVKKNKRKILLPSNMNPIHKRVANTYLSPHNVRIEYINYDHDTGLIDLEDLKNKIDENTAAVYVQSPNFFGYIEENAKEIGEIAHDTDSLFIMGVDPISLGLIKPPGELGADIAVGEGQPLGLGLNYGGPYLGIFATRMNMKLVRQMPGRIIGLTKSVDGSRAFTMILQTREQHIRRAKATSNICTNEALSAIAAAIYLALLGRNGIRKLAELIYYRSHYAQARLREIGLNTDIFKSDFFKEFPINFDNIGVKYRYIHEKLLENNIHGGLYIGNWFPELGETALYAFTEAHTKNDIDLLVEKLANIINELKR